MDTFKPTVSVLMSVYNETENEILESVWSIINQTYKEWELLIVNDNPNSLVYEGILSRVEKLDSRIRIIKNDHNMGLALSMNEAAKESKTDILARMDADDIAETTRFEDQIPYLLANAVPDAVVSRPRRDRTSSQIRSCLVPDSLVPRPRFAKKQRP